MTVTVAPVLARVVADGSALRTLSAALSAPVHAYLLVGPPGSGREEAARAFAAALVCPSGGCGQCRACRLAVAGTHPDVHLIERTGASITVGEAREVARVAARSPVEAARKVMILTDFHLVGPAAPALLKTIEEPPAFAVFVVLADSVPPELVTIASRCLRVDFKALTPGAMADALVGEGTRRDVAEAAAAASGGRLDRARLLAADPGHEQRMATWRSVPDQLDGTGATAARLAQLLVEGVEESAAPLLAAQAEEVSRVTAEARARGEKGGPGRELEERHRRQQRRARADELRAGLSVLAGAYRDRLVADPSGRAAASALAAVEVVEDAARSLVRNPNEALLLQALLVRLGSVGSPPE